MPKSPPPVIADLEDAGSKLLAEIVRDQMHEKVNVLRASLASVKDAERAAMRDYVRPSRVSRRKAEELHTIADQTTSQQARETFRYLARSYELLADRLEASETRDAEKKSEAG